jgi:hypothetical protein
MNTVSVFVSMSSVLFLPIHFLLTENSRLPLVPSHFSTVMARTWAPFWDEYSLWDETLLFSSCFLFEHNDD